ncbi:hypothetical protein HYX10_02205 [Candidatus Woesearchaeota archaeon]|nr:hypothetical protein [Candidatus Woesearchaeota archaeon]
MTIVADATALILLAKVSVLEMFADRNAVTVPNGVYDEVEKGKEKGRADALLVEMLVKQKKLGLATPKNSAKDFIQHIFNLKAGELEVISLVHKTENTVLTDDKKCFNSAKALGIGYITSPDVIASLFAKKAITKEKAFECFDSLEEYGWYAKDVIKTYREGLK